MIAVDSTVLFEFTVVANTSYRHHFTAASRRKQDYGPLLHDLQDSVPSADLVTIEIGCLATLCNRQ